MHGNLKIFKGSLKGVSIPMPQVVKGELNVTPALIKEALFQLIDNSEISIPSPFYDLCAASGQIGLEALSVGFSPVHLVEIHADRFSALLKEVRLKKYRVQLHKKDFRRLAKHIAQESVAVIFIDPPYSFWKDERPPVILEFLTNLFLSVEPVRDRLYLIFIQGPRAFSLPQELATNVTVEARDYRGNFLTTLTYKITPSDQPAT